MLKYSTEFDAKKKNSPISKKFGFSVNPIPTRGANYANRITACPPGFENLTVSLNYFVGRFKYICTV